MPGPIQSLADERSFRATETPKVSERLKVYVEAACQKMSTEEVLDLADHLHDLIRQRRSRTPDRRARAFC